MKECVLPTDEAGSDYNLQKLRSMIERCGCVITEVRRGLFVNKSVEEDIPVSYTHLTLPTICSV